MTFGKTIAVVAALGLVASPALGASGALGKLPARVSHFVADDGNGGGSDGNDGNGGGGRLGGWMPIALLGAAGLGLTVAFATGGSGNHPPVSP